MLLVRPPSPKNQQHLEPGLPCSPRGSPFLSLAFVGGKADAPERTVQLREPVSDFAGKQTWVFGAKCPPMTQSGPAPHAQDFSFPGRGFSFDSTACSTKNKQTLFCSHLANVLCAFLSLCFGGRCWLRRQLQYRCLLTRTQTCQEDNASIRKFECIVMRRRLIRVHLSKDCGRMVYR